MNSVDMSVEAVHGISDRKKFSLKFCRVFGLKSLRRFLKIIDIYLSTRLILLKTRRKYPVVAGFYFTSPDRVAQNSFIPWLT